MMKIVTLNEWNSAMTQSYIDIYDNFYLSWNVFILPWQIPESKVISIQTKSGEFKVPISEKGTKEEIWVDNKNGLEYFYVPANDGHVEADYLYDFKQVI